MCGKKISLTSKTLLLMAFAFTSAAVSAQTYYIVIPTKGIGTESVPAEPAYPSIKSEIDQIYGSTNSLVVTMPPTVEAGDLLLIQASNHPSEAYSTPAGWQQLFYNSSTWQDSAIFARSADGSEGGTAVIINLDGTAVSAATRTFRISDWSGDMSGVVLYSDSSDGSSTPDSPAANTTWGVEKTLFIALAMAADDSASFTGFPVGYSDGSSLESGADANNSVSLASAWKQAEFETDNPSNFTLSESENWFAATMAIAPIGATIVNVAPTLTITGPAEVYFTVGDTYRDWGATADDFEEGDITTSIVKSGSVNLATANTSTQSYDVTDSAGAAAPTLNRSVHVRNAPVSAPVVQDIVSQSFPTATLNHLVNMPATVTAGDLLITAFSSYDNYSHPLLPAGWTALYENNFGTTGEGIVAARIADGTEGGTSVDYPTDLSVSAAAITYRITNWKGDMTGVEIASQHWQSSSMITSPELTPSWGSQDTLWLSILNMSDDDQGVTTFPTNYVSGQTVICGGGTNAGCSVAASHRTLNAPSERPFDHILQSSEGAGAHVIAIH